MLTSFISHLLCGWFAFLLPSYKMFKALKHRPVSEPELERWAAYWSVIGAIVAFEYAAEWAISWFPFYWEIKTVLLLFLSLPQTEGSQYIYKAHLEPYYHQHEVDIDQGIESAKTEFLAWLQARVTSLWEIIYSVLSRTPIPEKSGSPQAGGQTAPNLTQNLQGLWSTYGPAVMGALGKAQQPQQPRPEFGQRSPSSASTTPAPRPTPPTSASFAASPPASADQADTDGYM